MNPESIGEVKDSLIGEGLKHMAEFGLHALAKHKFHKWAFRQLRGGEEILDERLFSEYGDLFFENPVMVGAGWDKKGWCVDGLYNLGFSGVEVGTVPVFEQFGGKRPRLRTDETHRVGLNSFGFSSPGVEVVAHNLASQTRAGTIGISVGKNKQLPDAYSPWAHHEVVKQLFPYGDYFVFNPTSPNTHGLGRLLEPSLARENLVAMREAAAHKPVMIKTSVDMSISQIDAVLDIAMDVGIAGVIDSNTSKDPELKRKYGWEELPGGLSGADEEYRQRCEERMRHITKVTRGTEFIRIGVGGISDSESAISRMRAGAHVVQLVTAIRAERGRVAQGIVGGMRDYVESEKLASITEIIDS